MYTKLRVIFALQLCIFARPVWSTEDYCAKNPCITKDPHAKCTNGSAGPKCACSSAQYSGSLCEKMSACSANPCNQKDNNAKCSEVTGGGYTCACSSKQYSGKNCEKSWCDAGNTNNPCIKKDHAAVCNDIVKGGYKCKCSSPNFSGKNCENSRCDGASNPCTKKDSKATCTLIAGGGYKCTCSSPQYSGQNCDKSWCDPKSPKNPCTRKDYMANCTDIAGGGYKCTCSSNQYSGKDCEKSWCDSGSSNNPCISKDSKAKCTDITGDGYKCTCSTKQYSGKNCEKSWCDPGSSNNPCISKDSKAKCTDIAGDGYKCTCSSSQYSGKNCEESWCDAGSNNNPCTSKDYNAVCTDIPGDGYNCTCSTKQYTGKNCQKSWCDSDSTNNPCISKDSQAKCRDIAGGGYKCTCSSTQYSGKNCDKSWCDTNSTNNPCIKKDSKAKCTDVAGGGYKCTCSTNQYSGKNCEKSWCDSGSTDNPCISKDTKAVCSDIAGDGYKCKCSTKQYSGKNCEKSWCDSNSTNNPCISKDSKAECIDIDGGGYKCACSSQQYSGENCEKSWCDIHSPKDPCISKDYQAVCTDIPGDGYNCTCSTKQYTGKNCEKSWCDADSTNNPCISKDSKAKCTDIAGDGYKCTCSSMQYSGKNCDKSWCDTNSTNNPCIKKDSKAKCTDVAGGGYKCTCSTNQYSGKDCQKSWCDADSGNNPCISKDPKAVCSDIAGDGYNCKCSSKQYSGKNCQKSWCDKNSTNNPCISKDSEAECIDIDGGGYECACSSPQYSGENCEHSWCDAGSTKNPCIHKDVHAHCVDVAGGGYTCKCSSKQYTGLRCEKSWCDAGSGNNPCISKDSKAICSDIAAGGYKCTCSTAQYTGKNCEKSWCDADSNSNPCIKKDSRAICTDVPGGGYKCTCSSQQYSGENCEKSWCDIHSPKDPCISKDYQAVCTDIPGDGYNCTCSTKQYTGKNCEKSWCDSDSTRNPCITRDLNAICSEISGGGYNCVCSSHPPQYSGIHCTQGWCDSGSIDDQCHVQSLSSLQKVFNCDALDTSKNLNQVPRKPCIFRGTAQSSLTIRNVNFSALSLVIPAAFLVEIHDSHITVEHGMDIVADYGVQIRGSTISASQASVRATVEDIFLDGSEVHVRGSSSLTLNATSLCRASKSNLTASNIQIVSSGDITLDHTNFEATGPVNKQTIHLDTPTGNIVLGPYTQMHAQRISVHSPHNTIEFRERTVLDASGRGGTGQETGSPWKTESGASHGGLGAFYNLEYGQPPWVCRLAWNGDIIGSLRNPTMIGAGVKNGGRGGGSVIVEAKQIVVNGEGVSISANGQMATQTSIPNSKSNYYFGGAGAGGSILLRASQTAQFTHSFTLSARGGAPRTQHPNLWLAGGGGGGRVAIHYNLDSMSDLEDGETAYPRVDVQGGALQGEYEYKYAGCVCGGAGTYVICESKECTLHVDNNNNCVVEGGGGGVGGSLHSALTPLDLSVSMDISMVEIEQAVRLATNQIMLSARVFTAPHLYLHHSMLYGPRTVGLDTVPIDARADGEVHFRAASVELDKTAMLEMRAAKITTINSEFELGGAIFIGHDSISLASGSTILMYQCAIFHADTIELGDIYPGSQSGYDPEQKWTQKCTYRALGKSQAEGFRSSNLVYARSITDMTIKGHLEAELVQLYAGGEINLMEKAKLAPTMTIGTKQECLQPVGNITDCNVALRCGTPSSSAECMRFVTQSHYTLQLWSGGELHVQSAVTSPASLICAEGDIDISGSIKATPCCSGVPGQGTVEGTFQNGGAGFGGDGGLPGPVKKDGNHENNIGHKYGQSLYPARCGSAGKSNMDSGGGGLIHIATNGKLSMQGGKINASGWFGLDSGGGSGGAISVRASFIAGKGVIVADGGKCRLSDDAITMDEGVCGGGGGGRIFFIWPIKNRRNNSAGPSGSYRSPGIQISSRGGYALIKNATWDSRGGEGSRKAEHCLQGHGGWDCAPCAAGTVNADGLDQCRPCAPGFFSDVGVQTKCAQCTPGKYSDKPHAESCKLCDVGRYANTPHSSECAKCPTPNKVHLGTFDFYRGVGGTNRSCPYRCKDNHAGSRCHACDTLPKKFIHQGTMIGLDGFSNNNTCSGHGVCIGAGKDPALACDDGIRCGRCICNTHYLAPYCVTAIAFLMYQLNGIYWSSALLAAVVIVLTLAFCFLCRLKGCPGYRKHSRTRSFQDSSQSLIDLQTMSNQPKSPSLTPSSRVARIYFNGNNSVANPLHLCERPPASVRDLSVPDAFAEFAQKVNPLLRFKKRQKVLFYALCVICYPIAARFAKRWRRKKLKALRRLWSKNESPLFQLKHKLAAHIEWSPDGSLTYFDVYKRSTLSKQFQSARHSPASSPRDSLEATASMTERVAWGQDELLVMFSGAGTYQRPFFVDPNDSLVKSVPDIPNLNKFIGQLWLEFVCELNQSLRVVDVANLPGTLRSVLRCVHVYKARAQGGDFGGLYFELALVRNTALKVENKKKSKRRSAGRETFQSLSTLKSLSVNMTADLEDDSDGVMLINEANTSRLQSYRPSSDWFALIVSVTNPRHESDGEVGLEKQIHNDRYAYESSEDSPDSDDKQTPAVSEMRARALGLDNAPNKGHSPSSSLFGAQSLFTEEANQTRNQAYSHFGIAMPRDARQKIGRLSSRLFKKSSCKALRLTRYAVLRNFTAPSGIRFKSIKISPAMIQIMMMIVGVLLIVGDICLTCWFLSTIACETNPDADDSGEVVAYCRPVSIAFWSFWLFWPPLIPLMEPVLSFAVVCFRTRRTAALGRDSSWLTLTSVVNLLLVFVINFAELLKTNEELEAAQLSMTFGQYFTYGIPMLQIGLRLLRVQLTQFFIALEESPTTDKLARQEWNALLYIQRHGYED